MHARTVFALALLVMAPMAGCIVPENMTALREELGYASVEMPELVAKARASTLSPRVAENVTFTADVTGVPLSNVTVTWTLGETTRQGRTVEHVFETPGPVAVNLTVTGDGADAFDTLSLDVQENQLPRPRITVPEGSTLTADEPITLSAASSTDPDGDPLTYAWTIDGEPAGEGVEIEPTLAAGVHGVKLVASDGLETAATFVEIAVDRPLEATGNLSATGSPVTTSFEVARGVHQLEVVLTHTTLLGVDDVDLTLLDGSGEPVATASTEPATASQTATETLTVSASDLSPGAYTLEATLERGISASVTIEGLLSYRASSS